jgi:hypothetical protein
MKIAIIGGGPAGVFTALLLKNFSGKITIFEQNKNIGEKLKLTGGGRMNISNKEFSYSHFWAENNNLLKKIFKNPYAKNPIKIFAELGVKYKWEKNFAFLQSENAKKEVFRLEKELQNQANLILKTNTFVNHIFPLKQGFEVRTQKEIEKFDIVVLASGGMFRLNNLKKPIYQLVSDLNHTLTPVSPALSALTFKNNPFFKLSGLSCLVKLFDPVSKKNVCGNLLFANNKISGPAVLDFSLFLEGDSAEINFCPQISQDQFLKEVSVLRKGKNSVKKFLSQYIFKRLSEKIMILSGIPAKSIFADLNKKQIKTLQNNLFSYSISGISRMDYNASWTTKGGVSLSEIVLNNLESKIHHNLFFAGEILEITGLCGGYNLSWSAISAKIISDKILL